MSSKGAPIVTIARTKNCTCLLNKKKEHDRYNNNIGGGDDSVNTGSYPVRPKDLNIEFLKI